MSAPGNLANMSKSAASARLTELQAADYAKNPGFYDDIAATDIQRIRRGHRQRNPVPTTQLNLTSLEGKTISLLINPRVRMHGLKSIISRETGVLPSNIILVHESSEEPIKTMPRIRELINSKTNTLDLIMLVSESENIRETMNELVTADEMKGESGEIMEVTFDTRDTLGGKSEFPEGTVTGVAFEGWTHELSMANLNEHGDPDMIQLCQNTGSRINIPNRITAFPQLQQLIFVAAPIDLLPPSLGSLTNLVVLRLVMTLLKSLPTSIGKLKNLKTLTIVDSCLTNKGIPKSLGNLKNLEALTIDNSPNVIIGDSITNNPRQPLSVGPDLTPILNRLTGLRTLDLEGTSTGSLNTPALQNLRHLNLSNTYLTAIPDWVYTLPYLAHFSAEGCYIREVRSRFQEADEQGLMRRTDVFPELTEISLGGNPLTQQGTRNYLDLIQDDD